MPEPKIATAGILLAAGEGKRFGGGATKMLAEFRGKPLVMWAVEAALGAGLEDLIVIMGKTDFSQLLPPEVTAVQNESWQDGQGGSLRVGLFTAETLIHKSVVVGLGDAPLVPTSAWVEVANNSGSIATAVYGLRQTPSPPVKLDNEVWPLLPLQGDFGAKVLMAKRPEMVAQVPCEGDPRDIDSQEDLQDLS